MPRKPHGRGKLSIGPRVKKGRKKTDDHPVQRESDGILLQEEADHVLSCAESHNTEPGPCERTEPLHSYKMSRKRPGRVNLSIGPQLKKWKKTDDRLVLREFGDNLSQEEDDQFLSCADFFLSTCSSDNIDSVKESDDLQLCDSDGLQLCDSEGLQLCDSDRLQLCDRDGQRAEQFFLVADKIIELSPTDDSEAVYYERMLSPHRYRTLKALVTALSAYIQTETGFLILPSSTITFVQFYDSDNPGIKCVVKIDQNTFLAEVIVHRQYLKSSHKLWTFVPNFFYSCENVLHLLRHVAAFGVCCGNPEFASVGPGVSAFQEQDFGAICGNTSYATTYRHIDCGLLVSGIRCSKCMAHRGALRKKKSLENKRLSNPIKLCTVDLISNRIPHSKMSKEQLCEKLCALQNERYKLTSELASLNKSRSPSYTVRYTSKSDPSTNNTNMIS